MSDQLPSPSVRLDLDGGVGTVTLARPGAMNALDIATKEALLGTLREVAADPAVRCVVLTGQGSAFSVGQDLKEHARLLREAPEQAWGTVREHYNPIVELIAGMDKPVIAAIGGVAAGAGASMAFAADLRYLSDTAGFTLAFAGVALSCDSGASWTLPRLVGVARATELMMLGGDVDAAEALRLGLATEVVPAADLLSRVTEVAHGLAAGPTLALGAIRRAVAFSAAAPLPQALEHEAELMDRTGSSRDHRAAVEAFVAKERPRFRGR
ncbi:MAG TPA: enoyl-CoA hydratase-related protein [Ornithinimicrobium sp.]|uniref:enoyl-CoA hydratase-related protein n=1 Tax=Ornithinimicrobium sp. TaxID=1977084 RepID=UPI002B475BEC|nr:enoyl-CoA hydratase-related protein [Ornithinimicrobium sp.]HKJ11287.1 enoyl-CoA hydratase-related protein [Ornithinimicrobium sp.]